MASCGFKHMAINLSNEKKMYKKFEFYFENLEIEKLRIEKNENLKKNKINGQKLIKIKY